MGHKDMGTLEHLRERLGDLFTDEEIQAIAAGIDRDPSTPQAGGYIGPRGVTLSYEEIKRLKGVDPGFAYAFDEYAARRWDQQLEEAAARRLQDPTGTTLWYDPPPWEPLPPAPPGPGIQAHRIHPRDLTVTFDIDPASMQRLAQSILDNEREHRRLFFGGEET